MSCPIYEEIKCIRGSGLYAGDDSDDSTVVLGSGETYVAEFARTHAMISRLEHSRFMASGATPEDSRRWWELRYARFSGRPLQDILAEMTPENCVARAIIDELVALTRRIREAIIRAIKYGSAATIPGDITERALGDAPGCSVPALHRGLEVAVHFAAGLKLHGEYSPGADDLQKIKSVRETLADFNPDDLPVPWSSSARFPELGPDAKESCCRAAAILSQIHEQLIVVEARGLELARIGTELSSVYSKILSRLG